MRFGWSIAASLALHLLLALGWLLAPPDAAQAPPPPAIAVDLISEAQFRQLQAPPAAEAISVPEPVAEPEPARAPVAAPLPDDGMQRATDLFAAGILADPANREVRETFPLLATSEQVTQICNIEGIEQVHNARPELAPDAVVAYAFGDTRMDGATLIAEGGAIRSAGTWYLFRFHCTVASDARSVTLFEFAVGDRVPEAEWEAHDLNSDDDWLR